MKAKWFLMILVVVIFATAFSCKNELWISYDSGAAQWRLRVLGVIVDRLDSSSAFAEASPYSSLVVQEGEDSWHIAYEGMLFPTPFAPMRNFEDGRVLADMKRLGRLFAYSDPDTVRCVKGVYMDALTNTGAHEAFSVVSDLETKLIRTTEKASEPSEKGGGMKP